MNVITIDDGETFASGRLRRRARARAAPGSRAPDCRGALRRAPSPRRRARVSVRSLLLNAAALNGLGRCHRTDAGRTAMSTSRRPMSSRPPQGSTCIAGVWRSRSGPPNLSIESALVDQPVRGRPRTRGRRRQRRVGVSQRRSIRRRGRPAQPGLLRSVLPQGDSDIVRRGAGGAVCRGGSTNPEKYRAERPRPPR